MREQLADITGSSFVQRDHFGLLGPEQSQEARLPGRIPEHLGKGRSWNDNVNAIFDSRIQ